MTRSGATDQERGSRGHPADAGGAATGHRVLVVHSQATFGEAIARRLSRENGFDVLGAVTRPVRALALVPAERVQTVILDWDFASGEAERVAGLLGRLDRPPVLVALGDDDGAAAVLVALRCGARAWLPKTSPVHLLIEALRCTAAGELYLRGSALSQVLDHLVAIPRQSSPSPLDVLTVRERDVLRCMAEGLEQSTIAARLFLSPNTVRTHRRRTLAKLGVHTSIEAVSVARRAGLLPQQSG